MGVRGSIRSERPARVLGTLGARPRVNHLRPVQARNIGLCLPSRVAERSLACADAPLSALRVAGVGVCQLRLAACHDLGRLHPAHLLPTLAAGSALQHYAVNPPVAPSLSKQECVVTPQGSMCGGGGVGARQLGEKSASPRCHAGYRLIGCCWAPDRYIYTSLLIPYP